MKILKTMLIFTFLLFLSGCDDFYREVDGVTCNTSCFNRGEGMTLVSLQDDQQIVDKVDEEIVIGIFNDKEYYFESITTYNYYLVQTDGFKGDYLDILTAIEQDDYTLSFLIEWCEFDPFNGDLKYRDIE